MIDKIALYNQLSTALKALYDASDPATELISETSDNYSLTTDQHKHFVGTIGDSILGIYKVAELPQKLQENVGVDEATAKAITSKLIELLSPVIEAEKNGASTSKAPGSFEQNAPTAETASNPIPIRTTHPELPATPVTKPEFEEPAAPESPSPVVIKPLRTMAEDIKVVHGYGAYRDANPHPDSREETTHSSSQDQLIQRPSLVEKPTYKAES